jgi:beta-glucanase (GH16 family)
MRLLLIFLLVYQFILPNGNQDDYCAEKWEVDFFDDFEFYNSNNWQDQLVWVNNEVQCYVPSGEFNTREVSNGTLKLRVVQLDSVIECSNFDKHGKNQPPTHYVASRICSKNKKEFIKGKWTARLRVINSGRPSQFPAWWLLGAQNDERPVQEDDEDICWPLNGSGEIDIFEHHGDHMKDAFTTGRIVSLNQCDKGDWWSKRTNVNSTLEVFHEYSVEWEGSDLVYRLDGSEVYRNVADGDLYTEPMFAILNYAKITEFEMEGKWEMEVDWVKHEKRIR